jgi:hypothetical protein
MLSYLSLALVPQQYVSYREKNAFTVSVISDEQKKMDFIFVGCILLRCLYVYFLNIPAFATDNLFTQTE